MESTMRLRISVSLHLMCITLANSYIVSTPVNVDVNTHGVSMKHRENVDRGLSEENRIHGLINGEAGLPEWMINKFFGRIKEPAEREVFSSMENCRRYCIQRSIEQNNDNIQYINLLWSVNGVNVTENSSSANYKKVNITEFQSADEKIFSTFMKDCVIHLDLDCNTVEMGDSKNSAKTTLHYNRRDKNKSENTENKGFDNTISGSSIKLVEKYNISGHTESRFFTNDIMSRIDIDVRGNVSSVLLQIPTNATSWRTGIKMSLARKYVGKGVRIDTRNAPPGEWWVKLTGVENSKYHFTVEAFIESEEAVVIGGKLFAPESPVNESSSEDTFKELLGTNYYVKSEIKDRTLDDTQMSYDVIREEPIPIIREGVDWNTAINSRSIDDRKIIFERSPNDPQSQIENDQILIGTSSNMITTLQEDSTIEGEIGRYRELTAFPSERKSTTLNNFASNEKSLPNVTSLREEEQKIRTRSSIGSVEDFEADVIAMPTPVHTDISMRMVDVLSNQELSEEFEKYTNEDTIERKKMLIDVNKNTDLLVKPGTRHRVVFDVMNSCVLPVRYAFATKSSHFTVYSIEPIYAWIYPGQMANINVDLLIPSNTAPDTISTLTLSIVGTEIKEKSVYLYAQSSLSKIADDVKPTIEYSFNNNCAEKQDKDRCAKSRWSVDVSIQDPDSGLKRVIATPNEIYPRTEFVSGTRRSVNFYYSASCCDTTAKITAIDILNNRNTLTIDVTAWNNLSGAEIAAITVGVLLVVLLIILIIIIIIYCVRRKRSHDLPYSQRYGSRSPPQAERTSF